MHSFLLTVSILASLGAEPTLARSPLVYHETFDRAPAGATAVEGKLGAAATLPAGGLRLASAGKLDKRQGTICLWVRPNWDGSKYVNHGLLADELDFSRMDGGNLYLWHWCVGQVRFDIRVDNRSNCAADVKQWHAGEWHHVAAAWDCRRGLWLFLDGRLAAQREMQWTPRPSDHFRVGSDWQGRAPADAAFDDLRIYDRSLDAEQVARIMTGRALPVVEYRALTAPERIVEDRPFPVRLELARSADLPPDADVTVSLDGMRLGTVRLAGGELRVPRYLHLAAGPRRLEARVAGTLSDRDPPSRAVVLETPTARAPGQWTFDGQSLRWDGRPLAAGTGLLADGVFYTGAAATSQARKLAGAGSIADAMPCRRLDQVDCTGATHDFHQTGESHVVELLPGRKFRLPGPAQSVKETRRYGKSDRKLLPSFSYRLETEARPTPHLLVVESINDVERNVEVAIDPAGTHPSPTAASSPRAVESLNLGVICCGREFPADGKPLRRGFLFFPSSNAVEVTISSSGREMEKGETPGAAVSSLAVYELGESLAALANPVETPDRQRHLALFYPEVGRLFREYGFAGTTATERRASVRVAIDYMRFLGFDRLEFHPYSFSRKANFPSKLFESNPDKDVFADILPAAQEAGIHVVPRMDSLCFYGDMWENEPINYQLTKNGKVPETFGKLPDPLRPPVQKLLLDMLEEMLRASKGYSCVDGVGFRANAKFGVLYAGNRWDMPPDQSGYSRWDVEQFERDTGVRVAADHGDPAACYAWLQSQAWPKWIDWRCRSMHRWWLDARDLARRYGRELFVRTVIPYSHHFPSDQDQWFGRHLTPTTVCQHHGFDPQLFHHDQGLLVSEAFSLGADRYNTGRVHNRAFWHDPRLADLVRTADGTEVELYYIYWELPTHPKGFRVGPSHLAGRAAFEPFTYALRTRNAYGLVFYNWCRATSGIDVELRRFARAYRALPAVAPKPFNGQCTPAADKRLWIRWFGDRLAVVNDSPRPRRITLTLAGQPGKTVYDFADRRTLATASAAGGLRCTLELDPFDLRTLTVTP
jgi:hypothetical protein